MTFDLASHHAYLIEGVFEILRAPLMRRIEEEFVLSAAGNPDFFVLEHAVFGIDEARELSERASRRPVSGERQVFVIGVATLTREAQNALLKLFEEPGRGTHFFLVVPAAGVLLPTLRSRLAILEVDWLGTVEDAFRLNVLSPDAFLAASSGQRLEMLKPLIVGKDVRGAAQFLGGLERALRAGAGEIFMYSDVFSFETLARCRDYVGDRSPSVKMILEYVAAVLPSSKEKQTGQTETHPGLPRGMDS